jgi:cytochrome c
VYKILQNLQREKRSIVAFLKGESEANVDPSHSMHNANKLSSYKTFSDEELQGLEAYVNH